MKEITLKKFLAHFVENLRDQKRFCFIIGAGASKISGIPTGAEMVQQWIDDLIKSDEDDFNKWVQENAIDRNDFASHYSEIFDKRFELSKKNGFAFLEKQMDGVEPSCGYSVLAQILAKGIHNIVITTNFDSLTEDALFIYTHKKPLVVGHASLADYISTTLSRPLIIKVHNDLFFSPKNSPEEVKRLDTNLSRNLKDVFKNYTPLVIGYGGNDGSLMNFLNQLDYVEEGMFWFYIEGSKPKQSIIDLVDKVDGHFIPIKGFDDFMIQLGNKLELEKLDTKIEEVAKQRADNYRKQVESLAKKETVDSDTKEAMSNIASRGEKNWWYYDLQAEGEKDKDKVNEIYLQGLKEFPASAELMCNYANFLTEVRKQNEEAEKYYLKALEIHPGNATYIGNYALFLYKVRKQYDVAEKCYLKALEINPGDANSNAGYAVLLEHIRKKYAEAEKYYKKALEIEPNNAYYIGNYALFLFEVKQQYDEAKNYYVKALEIDPENADNNGNYALFLYIVRKQYDEAEKYYLKALESDPQHANNNHLYALFLKHIRKNYDDAEKYFLKALEIEPNSASYISSYALFFDEVRKQYDIAEKYFINALELDPENANIHGNYAKHLIITNNKVEAKIHIEKAFEMNLNQDNDLAIELWFYCYAIFPKDYPESKLKIEELLNKGKKSIDWDLSEVLKVAKKDNHPDYDKLVEYNKRITQA